MRIGEHLNMGTKLKVFVAVPLICSLKEMKFVRFIFKARQELFRIPKKRKECEFS